MVNITIDSPSQNLFVDSLVQSPVNLYALSPIISTNVNNQLTSGQFFFFFLNSLQQKWREMDVNAPRKKLLKGSFRINLIVSALVSNCVTQKKVNPSAFAR